MIPIIWTGSARNDLRSIFAYIARDSRVYAQRMVDRIKAKVERLAEFPMLGGCVQEWDRDDVREIVVGSYRVIYQLLGDHLKILGVIHGARQLPDLDLDGGNGQESAQS